MNGRRLHEHVWKEKYSRSRRREILRLTRIERLIPTFLDLNDYRVCPYVYTNETLPEKYKPYANDIKYLSDLKVLTNKYNSDELYDVWNYFRMDYLRRNPSILGLE
jgi:hypothetical protein